MVFGDCLQLFTVAGGCWWLLVTVGGCWWAEEVSVQDASIWRPPTSSSHPMPALNPSFLLLLFYNFFSSTRQIQKQKQNYQTQFYNLQLISCQKRQSTNKEKHALSVVAPPRGHYSLQYSTSFILIFANWMIFQLQKYQTLSQLVVYMSNFNLVLFGKVREIQQLQRIHVATLANPCNN